MAALGIDFYPLDPVFVGAVSVAYELACNDIAVFKVNPKTKRPITKDWDGTSSADIEIAVGMFWRTPKAGVAIDCKKSGFVIIDLDRHPGQPDGVAAFDSIVPPDVDWWAIPTIETPDDGFHLYFKQPEGEQFGNSEGSLPAGINVRGAGGYVVAPGTKKADGSGWNHVNRSPPIWEAPPLPEWIAAYLRKTQKKSEKQTRAQPLAEPGPRERAYAQAALGKIAGELSGVREGGRNIALNTAALKLGHFVASGWLSQSEAETVLIESCKANGSWGENHVECVATIASGMTAGMKSPHAPLQDRKSWGDGAASLPEDLTFIDPETGEILEAEAEGDAGNARPVFDPWQKFIVPDFPLDVLPPVVADFVASQSDVIGCDPSALAMACLATFSGVLNHSIKLKMMEHGEWQASPRLWVLLVGDPSTKKSPAIKTALDPCRRHETAIVSAYKVAFHEWQEIAAIAKAEKRLAPPPPPLPQRFMTNDTTVEKVGEILSRSDRGILIHADELAGWIGSMERYANGKHSADRGVWLQSFDGGPSNIDRIGRGEIFVPNLSTTIIGGIQPEKLAEFSGLTSDGLLQRFIPVMLKSAKFTKDLPASSEQYNQLVMDLIKCAPELVCFNSPAYKPMLLAPRALKATNAIRERIFDIEQNSNSIAAGFAGFLGKLAGLAGSISLILHMVENPHGGISRAVSAQTVERAGRVVFEFILPHALEFYQNAQGNSSGEKLRKIASWILTSGKSTIAVRDFVRCVSSMKGMGTLDVNRAVAPLVAAGWLKPVEKGLLCGKWEVPPSVFTQMAERAEIERKRTKTLSKLMNAKWAR